MMISLIIFMQFCNFHDLTICYREPNSLERQIDNMHTKPPKKQRKKKTHRKKYSGKSWGL